VTKTKFTSLVISRLGFSFKSRNKCKIRAVILVLAWTDTGEKRTSIRITGLSAEVKTEHLPDTKQKFCHISQLAGCHVSFKQYHCSAHVILVLKVSMDYSVRVV
jgi:hypothetical protein